MATVELERTQPHITVVRLNRPERRNAINYVLVSELHDALDEVADPDCKVVVLTGSGRGFCAGLDLKDWGTPPGPGEHRHAHAGIDGQAFMSNLTVHMRASPQVNVAAVNGPVFGGGLVLTKEVLWHNVDNPSMTAAIALENRSQTIANRAADVQQFMEAYRRRTTRT